MKIPPRSYYNDAKPRRGSPPLAGTPPSLSLSLSLEPSSYIISKLPLRIGAGVSIDPPRRRRLARCDRRDATQHQPPRDMKDDFGSEGSIIARRENGPMWGACQGWLFSLFLFFFSAQLPDVHRALGDKCVAYFLFLATIPFASIHSLLRACREHVH